jgi:hypothetical protein
MTGYLFRDRGACAQAASILAPRCFFRKSPIEGILVRRGVGDIEPLLGRFGLPCSKRLASWLRQHVMILVDCEGL